MTPLYIFDLDGTLALIDHRRHLVQRINCEHCGNHGWVNVAMDMPPRLPDGWGEPGGQPLERCRLVPCPGCGGTSKKPDD